MCDDVYDELNDLNYILKDIKDRLEYLEEKTYIKRVAHKLALEITFINNEKKIIKLGDEVYFNEKTGILKYGSFEDKQDYYSFYGYGFYVEWEQKNPDMIIQESVETFIKSKKIKKMETVLFYK